MGYQLARSPWPRTAADRRHSRRVGVLGPRAGRVIAQVALVAAVEPRARGGIGVAEDGSLRVACGGLLIGCAPDGTERWRIAIPGARRKGSDGAVHSAPAVMADGSTVVIAGRGVAVIDAGGAVRHRVALGFHLDDSGPAPTVTDDGALVLSCPTGVVLTLSAAGVVRELGDYGYDVVAPAITADGALVIAGYAGAGLVRVARDGTRLWRSGFGDADMLPTVRATGEVACGSRNDKQVRFFASDGALVATFPAAGAVGEAGDGAWVVVSNEQAARVDASGAVEWTHELGGEVGVSWGALGPAIDREDACLVPTARGVMALDRAGAVLFEVPIAAPITDVAIVGEGHCAVLAGGELAIVV